MPDVPLKTTSTKAAARARVTCQHCRTPFVPTAREEAFCCSGCRFVFHLLHKRGLEDFYRFGETQAPVGAQVFHERSMDWLREWQQEAETTCDGAQVSGTLRVQGISCAGCVWLLEAVFAEHPGAISCRVNSSSGRITLRWERGACDLAAYAADVQRFGYLLGAPSADVDDTPTTRPLVRKLGICGALALNAMLFALPGYLGLRREEQFLDLFEGIAWLIATISMLVGGTYFIQRAWGALRLGELHIDVPIALGLVFAYTGSVVAWRSGMPAFAYFDFVSIFTFLMLLGRWLQERTVEGNRRRLLDLRVSPGRVRVLRDGAECDVPAESLKSREWFAVARNALVPVRARLRETAGLFALNWINGEPEPRPFSPGNLVPSGARSLSPEPLEFVALEDWDSSHLARLLAFHESGSWRNTGLQRLIRVYLSCILVTAATGFAGWMMHGSGWLVATQVLISVLVVSCPCAIGVALPLLDDVAAASLQPLGVYVREGSLWSRIQKVRAVLFDKTGTITLESLALANPEALDTLPDTYRSALLHLVAESLHPVAACLREELLARGVEPPTVTSLVTEHLGMGLESNGWRLGRASWAAPNANAQGTVFARNGAVMASFGFREELRTDAREQIQALERQGGDVHLLSGDEPQRVRAMASALGLPEARGLGGLTPEEKAELVRSRWGGCSLILGDGANDSLAFDAALCRGTPAVDSGLLEHKADFYLLGRSLAGLGSLFSMAARHRLATRAVFAFAITYNALAVSASLAGWMNPLVAAIIMPLSSLASIGLVFLLLRAQAAPDFSTFTAQPKTHHDTTN